MTSSSEFNRALCTEIGLAGAPFVVNATQYAMAGQSDLFTFVKFLSSYCWEMPFHNEPFLKELSVMLKVELKLNRSFRSLGNL